MKTDSLTQKTKSALSWSALETFCNRGMAFAIQILLARLVAPEEFGLISLVTIFTNLASLIVNSGFSQSLIQKEHLHRIDCSTGFVCNLVISWLMYGLLFFAAPWISDLYDESRLTLIVRVLGLSLPISALSIVQQSILVRQLSFRRLFLISTPALVGCSIISVTLAAIGFGVWALVAHQLGRVTIAVAGFWIFGDPILSPRLRFSSQSFRQLFRFGIGILGSSVVYQTSQNLYGLLIGKFFSFSDLAFYNRGKSFHHAPAITAATVLNRVLFPVMSSIQNEPERILAAIRRGIPLLMFWVCPAMTFLMCSSEAIVVFLLTDKWLESAEYMRWFPVVGIIYPLAAIQLSVLRARGRSTLLFWIQILKNGFGVVVLIYTLQWGVLAVVLGHVVLSVVLHLGVNGPACRHVFGYRLRDQLMDVAPYLCCSFFAGAGGVLVQKITGMKPGGILLFLQFVTFFVIYIFTCRVVNLAGLQAGIRLVADRIAKVSSSNQ